MFTELSYVPEPRQFFSGGNNPRCFMTLGACSYSNGIEILFNGPDCHVMFGNYCSVAHGCTLMIGLNHDPKNVTTFPFRDRGTARRIFGGKEPWGDKEYPLPNPNRYQIIIGNDVWLGRGATLFGGVRIGNGAIVGTNSLVTRDIPPYAIAVGSPARVVKYRFPSEVIHKLLAIKWWNWSTDKIWENVDKFERPEQFVEEFYSPELERFDDDELSKHVRNFRAEGSKAFMFVADFRAVQPLWQRIIRGFINASALKSRLILVMWTGLGATDSDLRALTDYVGSLQRGGVEPHVLVARSTPNNIFSPSTLRQADYFITTRDAICTQCIDYLEGTNAKIISALDESIFPGEREWVPIWAGK